MPADDAGIAAMQHLSTKLNNSYPSIRTALSPEYRHLSSENIEGLLQQTLGNEVSAEDLEDLLGSLKSIGRSAVQVLPAVLPIAGTVVGTAIGGPVGGALGGIAGQVAGQAVGAAPQRPARRSTQRSTQRPPGNQVSTVGRSAGRVPARIPTSVPARAQGTQATAQLLRSLSNPQVQQALLAMLLGSAGRQSVQIAGEPVPVAAVGNTLGVLLQNAMTEYSQLQGIAETAVPHYLLDEAGEFLVDPAVPEARAARVMELIDADSSAGHRDNPKATSQTRLREALLARAAELYEQAELDLLAQVETDAAYDELELSELYIDNPNED